MGAAKIQEGPIGSNKVFDDDYERSLADELAVECEVMIKFAMKSGLKLPAAAVETLGILSNCRQPGTGVETATYQGLCDSLKVLALAHEQLSQLVAPATPRTLLHYATEKATGVKLKFLGPIKMVVSIVVIAILFLLTFILLSILLNKYPGNIGWTFHLQLLTAAGIGGSFSALFEASRYIVNSSFDPRYKGYYWIKIVLGLTAGYILAQLIPLSASADGASLAPATLALLGGFSGTVVYNILKRISEGVESMVHGDAQATIDAQQTVARAQATDQVNKARIKQAAGLMQVQNLVASNATPRDIQSKIAQLLDEAGVGLSDSMRVPPGTNNGRADDSSKQNGAGPVSQLNQNGAGTTAEVNHDVAAPQPAPAGQADAPKKIE
ncbi:MAG TPA: hypothetical protein VI756_01845 [Blastocatellia bacterium]